jgi:hypothetical protein
MRKAIGGAARAATDEGDRQAAPFALVGQRQVHRFRRLAALAVLDELDTPHSPIPRCATAHAGGRPAGVVRDEKITGLAPSWPWVGVVPYSVPWEGIE